MTVSTAEALLPPLIFSGSQKPVQTGDKSPADFVRTIQQRAAAAEWDDKKTMSHAITCLQGEAAAWLYGSLKLTITPAEWENISTSWTTFLEIFRNRYLIKEVPAQTDLSGLRRQQPTESTRAFMDRVARTFGTLIGKQTFLDWLPDFDITVLTQKTIDAIEENDASMRTFWREMTAHEERHQQYTLVFLIEAQAKATIASGLRNEHAQQLAYSMIGQSEGRVKLLDFQQKILEITERKDNLAKTSQPVRAIGTQDSDHDEEEETNAANAVRSGKNKKRNRNKKTQGQETESGSNGSGTYWTRDPNRNPNFGKQCDYCKKYNHIAKDCFKKKRDENKKATKVAATQEQQGASKEEVNAASSHMGRSQEERRNVHLNF